VPHSGPIMSAVEEVEVVTSGSVRIRNAQSGVVNISMRGKADKWRDASNHESGPLA